MFDTLLYFFIGLLFLFVICIAAFLVAIFHLFTYVHPDVNGFIKNHFIPFNKKLDFLDDKLDCSLNLLSSIISKLSKND